MARLLTAVLAAVILVGPTAPAAAAPTATACSACHDVGVAVASPSPGPTAGSDGITARQWVALAAAVALALGLTMRFAAGRQLRRAHDASHDDG
jgi:hypothetical protein